MTWYVCDIEEYLKSLPEIGRAYRAVMGRHFPAMALVQVVRLVEREARVEIETTAVITRLTAACGLLWKAALAGIAEARLRARSAPWGLAGCFRRPVKASARVLAAGAATLSVEAPARAGFLQPEGTTQVITSGSGSRFSRQFDAKGRLRRAATFSKANLETWVQNGL